MFSSGSFCVCASNILHYTWSLPMKMLLDKCYILLVKDCLDVSSKSVLKMCALIASNESDFNDMCVGSSVHHNMPRSAIRAMFGEALRLSLGLRRCNVCYVLYFPGYGYHLFLFVSAFRCE